MTQDALTAEELRVWSRASGYQTARALGFDISVIAGVVSVVEWHGGWLLYLLSIPIIGARQHALLGLAHEAAHLGLARDRRVNDAIGRVIGWMFLLSFLTYRRSHLAHHRHLNEPRDPDWLRYNAPDSPDAAEFRFPVGKRRLAWLLLGDLFALRALQLLSKVRQYRARPGVTREQSSLLPAIGFYTLLLALLALGGWKVYLLYWVVPIFTWVKMNLRLRLIGEHYCIRGQDGTRSVVAGAIERFFLWPHRQGYHAEHHAFPGVRCRHLPELARHLSGSFYEQPGVARTYGLRALIREVTM